MICMVVHRVRYAIPNSERFRWGVYRPDRCRPGLQIFICVELIKIYTARGCVRQRKGQEKDLIAMAGEVHLCDVVSAVATP